MFKWDNVKNLERHTILLENKDLVASSAHRKGASFPYCCLDVLLVQRCGEIMGWHNTKRVLRPKGPGACWVWQIVGFSALATYRGITYNHLPCSIQIQFQVTCNHSLMVLDLPQLCLFLWICVSLKSRSLILKSPNTSHSQKDQGELPFPGSCDAVPRKSLIILFPRPTVHVG